jgi:hypothetical protein
MKEHPMFDDTVPDEVDPTDPAWDLEGDDSVGDADDPHRNDQEDAQ